MMQASDAVAVSTSVWVELVRKLPEILAAVFSGLALLIGVKNKKTVNTLDQKADAISVMVDGHATAQAKAIQSLHDQVVQTQEKRIEDIKQVAATVAPDPSKVQLVVPVDRRKDPNPPPKGREDLDARARE